MQLNIYLHIVHGPSGFSLPLGGQRLPYIKLKLIMYRFQKCMMEML